VFPHAAHIFLPPKYPIAKVGKIHKLNFRTQKEYQRSSYGPAHKKIGTGDVPLFSQSEKE